MPRSIRGQKTKELFKKDLEKRRSEATGFGYIETTPLQNELKAAMDGCETVVCALGALETDIGNLRRLLFGLRWPTNAVIEAASSNPSGKAFSFW
jgi:hypothetical protein